MIAAIIDLIYKARHLKGQANPTGKNAKKKRKDKTYINLIKAMNWICI